MSLPVADLRAGLQALATLQAHGAPQPLQAVHWSLQLHRAAARIALQEAGTPRPAARKDEEPTELESCGGPAAPGTVTVQASAAVATHPEAREESLPPCDRHEREADRSPVRLHVQAAPLEGVRIWLGIDGDAVLVAQRASVAIADLRRSLQSSGDRITSLVCNGVPVADRTTFPAAAVLRHPPLLPKDSP